MNEHHDVVIVGAGHAGVNLAAYLSKGGYQGSVALLSNETILPYKRPPLSKGFLLDAEPLESLPLRTAEYWAASPVDLQLGVEVLEVRPDEQTVVTASGRELTYGRLVWAAGGRARSLPLPGATLPGVHQVRTLDDVLALKQELPRASRAVFVGGGYIGLETAAAFRGLGLDVTVIEAAGRVLERVTSAEISEYFHRVHREAGVDIRLGATVKEFTERDGRVASVVLGDGEVPADVVVVGIGLVPNIDILAAAGASCSNGIEVDELCRTSLPAVSAIGDCTSQLNPYAPDRRMRLESVQNANEQAKVVASDLLGRPAASGEVPKFWSDQYHIKLKTAGLIAGHDQMVVRGDPGSGVFSVLYLSAGRLVAIDSVNNPVDFAKGSALIKQRAQIAPEVLADSAQPLQETGLPLTAPGARSRVG
ncbi:NAD(P)/FAD-dependent oxidoreductase [Arthrobacter mobilis]|uniref:Oxidoreductase n=1 Tax=Arthrobacter mobilis TaxID=2724944 RepID=A0A7X6K5M1_9MICC|nr:FAD-dependent oxidoreductase [Arthrobacter mobilis]NKX55915.1 oxidoreductase [Arthrobacter mobilis]